MTSRRLAAGQLGGHLLVPIDRLEERGERRAERQATPAVVALLEDPREFAIERARGRGTRRPEGLRVHVYAPVPVELRDPETRQKKRRRWASDPPAARNRSVSRHAALELLEIRRAPAGSDRRATSRPWRVSRTTRRSRRRLSSRACGPCPGTSRCTRRSHRRRRRRGSVGARRSACRSPGSPTCLRKSRWPWA